MIKCHTRDDDVMQRGLDAGKGPFWGEDRQWSSIGAQTFLSPLVLGELLDTTRMLAASGS